MLFPLLQERLDEGAGSSAELPAAWPTAAPEPWRFEIERLLRICEALWTFWKEPHGYTDEDLFRRVMEIDLHDGRANGRVGAAPVRECPHGHRPMTRGRPICMYCGRASAAGVFER
ncbi:MAG: hypothetical protein N2652_07280 [Kiritimatiellae bacterium]|nr:hypothetical protein [Kiritimatiellia bacterium]